MLSTSTLGAIMAALIATTANAAPVASETTITDTAPAPTSPSFGLGAIRIAPEDTSPSLCTQCCGKPNFWSLTDSAWASQPPAKAADCDSLLQLLQNDNRTDTGPSPFISPGAIFSYKSCHVTLKPVGSTGNPYTLHRKNDVAPLLRQAIQVSRQYGGEMKARGHIACDVGNTGLREPLDFEVKGPSAAPMSTSPSFGLDYRSDPPADSASDICTRCCSSIAFNWTDDPEWNRTAAAFVEDCMELRGSLKEKNSTKQYVPRGSGWWEYSDQGDCRVTITVKEPANSTAYMNTHHDIAHLLDDAITLFADAHGRVKARGTFHCKSYAEKIGFEVRL
ncbi:hypothetical protein PG997_011229 [Apiospora hydei]|uniref:Ecp2 effector protein-like domain-containing protein n=1 Tax=Apiospora hydei TaxID=1337664 RepID=A0ABR1VIG3_9PEZI